MKRWNSTLMTVLLIIAIIVIIVPFGIDAYRFYLKKEAEQDTISFDTYLDDSAQLFTMAGKGRVHSAMQEVAVYTDIAVVTTEDTGGYGTVNYAQNILRDTLDGTGIVFLIDMQHRQIYLYTDNGNTLLSVAKCESITDNVYRYASKENYDECAVRAIKQVAAVMGRRGIPEPMKHISNLLLSAAASLLIVFIIADRKTKIKKPNEVYQLDKNISKDVKLSNMNTQMTSSHKVYNSSGSGSGGGISGGFSGGGGGGGGGGGHGGGHGF